MWRVGLVVELHGCVGCLHRCGLVGGERGDVCSSLAIGIDQRDTGVVIGIDHRGACSQCPGHGRPVQLCGLWWGWGVAG